MFGATTKWVLGTELNPLQEKNVLLSTEPSLQHLLLILFFRYGLIFYQVEEDLGLTLNS